jgi:hypothetical protein
MYWGYNQVKMIRFRLISAGLILAFMAGLTPCLWAQDAGGPGGPGGRPRGGFPGGGFPGGGFPGGGFGGPGGGFGRRGGGFGGRGFGGPGGGNEFANINPADLVRRIDTNHDGVIETSEINDRTRPLLQKAGLPIDEPISNDRVIAAFEKLKSQSGSGGRFPGGGDDDMGYSSGASSGQNSGAKKSDSSVPALVPAFGEATDVAPVPGFGEGMTVATASFGADAPAAAAPSAPSSSGSSSSSAPSSTAAASGSSPAEDPKIRSYATSMMKRYDKNGDGILDKSEWSQMSGDPEKYDRNHDGKITLDELIDGLKNWNRPDNSGSAAKPADATAGASAGSNHSTTNTSAPASDSTAGANASGPGGHRGGFGSGRNNSSANSGPHYRSPKERLPEGLPDWFLSADADGDGQVSLHEFAPTLTEEKIAEFSKYDLNGDGFITPGEVLKVAPPKK